MNNQEEKSLDDLKKELRNEIELKYEIDFCYEHIFRKAVHLWEAIIQTADNELSFTGEGATQKEALIDVFNKAKLYLDPDEAVEKE